MTSSLEIFDAETMEHAGTHSFGIQWGSLTWVDWHDSHWWMTFANYDVLLGPGKTPYGHKANTVMVKLTKDFRPVQSWTLPKAMLDRFEEMSNWGDRGVRTAISISRGTIRRSFTGCGCQKPARCWS